MENCSDNIYCFNIHVTKDDKSEENYVIGYDEIPLAVKKFKNVPRLSVKKSDVTILEIIYGIVVFCTSAQYASKSIIPIL